ncbi:MAG: cation:proton antiporter [Candidatus Heimdallarchaeota archaeon]|nr:cation:proton antiporter [Candidatus Heimdallarchaeota archaeon]
MATSDYELPFLLIALSLTLIKASQIGSRKLGLPDVLGELIVGIILGPTIMGILYLKAYPAHPTSSISWWLHLDEHHLDITGNVINFISEFAVLLLLFKVGMEVEFDDMKLVKKPAFLTAMAGIILPFLGGVVFIYTIVTNSSLDLIPAGEDKLHAAIFLGSTLTATSIGISTRLFLDYNKMRTKVAQTVVGSAIIDDIVAVVLFSLVLAYFSEASSLDLIGVLGILLNIAIFFFVSFMLYKYVLPYFFIKTKMYNDTSVPVFVSIAFMLYMAVFSQMLGLAPIIGAFVAGVIIGNEDDYLDIHKDFEPIGAWIIPFFFLDIGLSVDLSAVASFTAIGIAVILLLIAFSSKYLGGLIGTAKQGYTKGQSHTTGVSMAARGEVTLIFAFSGYSLGYFTDLFYGIIILSVVLLAFIIVPLLKHAIKQYSGDELGETNFCETEFL